MRDSHTQLAILAKAVQYKNLSLAASHVGLSQPQLSRIIAKLEEDLQVVLLDRGVRRKSAWTMVAHQLVEVFVKANNELQTEIQKIINKPMHSSLKIGSLEGLSLIGIQYCKNLFQKTKLKEIHLNIFEIGELEEKFEAGELDLIFSFRVPGRQKYKNVIEIGYQSVDKFVNGENYHTFSQFEYIRAASEIKKIKEKIFVSDSLELRKYWLENIGGVGYLPSAVIPKPQAGKTPIYLVGSDLLSPLVWQEIQ